MSLPFWTDIVAPTPEMLTALAKKEGFSSLFLEDCMDSRHLPKIEPMPENGLFVILRTCDPHLSPDADTLQAMTRKLALFYWPDRVISVHRRPLPLLDSPGVRSAPTPELLCLKLIREAILSYKAPTEKIEGEIDQIEAQFLAREVTLDNLTALYKTRRQLMVFKRMSLHLGEVLQEWPELSADLAPVRQDLREKAQAMFVSIDEMLEDLNSLLNLQLAFASQRTNEVVRVLTLFSVFFMPLTFIVGVYGMNFKHMPELDHAWGYPGVWGLMVLVSWGIWIWFRRKGWLK